MYLRRKNECGPWNRRVKAQVYCSPTAGGAFTLKIAKSDMEHNEYARLRKTMGTQSEVAAMLETARETIARRETGKDRITREAALALFGLSKLPKNQRTPDAEGS